MSATEHSSMEPNTVQLNSYFIIPWQSYGPLIKRQGLSFLIIIKLDFDDLVPRAEV